MQEEFEIEELEGDEEELSLLETVDHVLDKGVVVAGDITISVANIDLIYLNLNALLGSVETINRALARREAAAPAPPAAPKGVDTGGAPKVLLSPLSPAPPNPVEPEVESVGDVTPTGPRPRPAEGLPERVDVNPRSVEQGLGRLVLTLIELVRRLLEKQAVRRMEGGGLTDAQVEELGLALMKLEEKMRELKRQFGIDEDEDLNLDLGPVGRLI